VVQCAVADGADDVAGPHDVPCDASFGAVGREDVFLGVVEVCLEVDPRVGFEGGVCCRADVEAVVLCASLQEEAFGLQG
jgi:hypothetical protein